MSCKIYKLNTLGNYKYVVMFSQYQEEMLLSRHKARDTWELQGGHIEKGETPLMAAKRELYEESGALDYEIEPLFDYWVEEGDNKVNGVVFRVAINKLGKLPESEIAEIKKFKELPENLTYPDITKAFTNLYKNEILSTLKDKNIEFELISHKAIYTVADGVNLNIPADTIAKNLFLCDKKKDNYYLFTLYKDTQISLKELQEKINSKRLSFVQEDDLFKILGLQKGCVSPLGVFNNKTENIKVYIDEYFKTKPIAVPLNKNTITILLNADDLISILKQTGNQIYWLSI